MTMYAQIRAVEYYLPDQVIDNESLAARSDSWTAEAIYEKTGIRQRHCVRADEFTSDLAVAAAERLLASADIDRAKIEFLIVCTQTPDRLLPTTACVVQQRLGLSTGCGALDVNLGCSGYVYCLSVAKGLIESGQVRNVLLLTADTYSKLLDEDDLSVRTLFGDAAAATFICGDSPQVRLNHFVHGTDGSGADYLMAEGGGLRVGNSNEGSNDSRSRLTMDGPAIFHFTLDAVPKLVNQVLEKSGCELDQIDLFVFHQANAFMLEHLRKKLKISLDRFVVGMEDCGNTVSSSIPIALQKASVAGQLKPGQRVMLVGFGVGLSWSGCLLDWNR